MKRLAQMLVLGLMVALSTPPPAAAAVDDDVLDAIDAALSGWDLEAAQRAIDAAGAGIEVEVKLGVLRVYEGRYTEAEQILATALASGELTKGSAAEEEARHHLALARGSQRALGGAVEVTSPDGHVVAAFTDGKDALLAPYLFEAMVTAREALADEIGVSPAHPVRFEFYDDPTKLAMVTPLTVKNIRTTGTVGVTKYRRIMMISPRVMLYGYGWLDTAIHEYVHYVVTLRTQNQAPVWLQEGLAKLLEARWRRPSPEPLEPGVAFRLHQAIVKDDLVTFSEMYPSVAMLPSAERAALAYAEVETMLSLVRERKGSTGIDVLLDRVEAGDDAETALATAWGDDFEAFMRTWKRVTKGRTSAGKKSDLGRPVFKGSDDDEAPDAISDVFSHLGGGKARQHARLGTLLQGRGHKDAASQQYEKARTADARARKDPALSRRLGRLYVDLRKFPDAVPLLQIAADADPDDANLAAAQGRANLRIGNTAAADQALHRAIRVNPFIPSIHCDLAELAPDDATREREQSHCKENKK